MSLLQIEGIALSREDAIRFVQNIIDEFSINKEELDL